MKLVDWVTLIVIGAGYGAGKLGDAFGKFAAGSAYDLSSSVNWF
ncbi:hypothetical protein [Shewanella japonica]|nr:hypothetical protein [Shewanella japonica]